jgi:hypothetical protein
MKHILIAFLISFSFLSFTTFENLDSGKTISAEIIKQDCKNGQCQATAKSTGKQCKHCVSNAGDKFCYQHK